MPQAQHFDWHLIPSFLAVLDAGSLTGAARISGAQQPTLSRHISELEAQLGVALFERTGRGALPTAAALSLASSARHMAEGAEQLSQRLARGRELRQGTVRISASQAAAAWLLPPLLAELQAQEPGIQIELVASNTVSNLLRREADIALRMMRPEQASLVAKKLGEVPIVAAAHPSYLRRAGTPQTPEQLLQHRLIGYDQDEAIVRGFAQRGLPLTREHFALRTDDHITYAQLVASGAGIGFLARYTLPLLGGLQALLPQIKTPSLPCWLVVHREVRGSPLVRRVFDFLAQQLPARI